MTTASVEQLTPNEIRTEIERGGRFVYYPYCVSVLVVTLKRASRVTFIPPGKGRVVPGLGYALISLLFGWWGIPWGFIYTPQCLWQILVMGGVDVTEDVLASIAPPAPAKRVEQPPPLSGSLAAPNSSSQSEGMRARSDGHDVAEQTSPRKKSDGSLVRCLAIIVGVLGCLYIGLCFFFGSTDVIVVSGWPEPYAVVVNGQEITVEPDSVQKLGSHNGPIIFTTVDGRSVTAEFKLPFLKRPWQRHLAILNPDATAVYYQERMFYRERPSSNNDDDGNDPYFRLFAGKVVQFVPKPNYVFAEFPRTLRIKSGESHIRKRLALLKDVSFSERIRFVSGNGESNQKTEYAISLLTARPEDGECLKIADEYAPDEDILRILEPLRSRRPVNLTLHRAWQSAALRLDGERDVSAEYAQLASAEPDNGSLAFLVAHAAAGQDDEVAARAFYEKALAAANPEPQAHWGLALLAAQAGEVAQALACIQKMGTAGIDAILQASLRYRVHLMARDYSAALDDLRALRENDPRSFSLLLREAALLRVTNPESVSTASLWERIARQLRREKISDSNVADLKYFIEGDLFYAAGDEMGALARLEADPDRSAMGYVAVRRAVASRDYSALVAVVGEKPDLEDAFLMRLLALRAGNAAAADKHMGQARDILLESGNFGRRLAAHLAGESGMTPRQVCSGNMDVAAKRLLIAQLAMTDADNRDYYRKLASVFNGSPEFPHLLIEEVLSGL